MKPEANVTEIAPDLYRLSVYVSDFDLQFNQFLVDDDEPLLYHAGLKGMFPLLREAVAKVLEPSRLRWIGFSHFESDECGGLNEWLAIAPVGSTRLQRSGRDGQRQRLRDETGQRPGGW